MLHIGPTVLLAAVSILPSSALVETRLAFLHRQQRLWKYIIFSISVHCLKPWRLHLLNFIQPISSIHQRCDLISDSIQTNNKWKILILHWHSDNDSLPSSPPNTSLSILEQCKKLCTHDNYKPERTKTKVWKITKRFLLLTVCHGGSNFWSIKIQNCNYSKVLG